MVSEDSSKQERMIEDIEQDAGVILVTLTKDSSQKDQPEGQLGVPSVAKILTNATKVHTYSRIRRAVNTGNGAVSTTSRIISTTEEIVSTAGVSMPVSTTDMVQEGSSKKQKTDEASGSVQEQLVEEEKELSQEDLQQLMFIAPKQEMNVEPKQVKYLIIYWEIYTEDSMN
nr:hypothetical protein [Tanacetum cinerariifolium]